MLERLHSALYVEVGQAVRPVHHVETTWSEGEMVRRIVSYIYRAAGNEELRDMVWDQVIVKFLQGAMGRYCASCQEKTWFYDLDLSGVFARAAWEVLSASTSRQPRPAYQAVLKLAENEFQSCLDETLHNKAMWIAVKDIFKDAKHQSKVLTSLQRTYQVALDFVLSDTRPLEDIVRLQGFLKKWMEDSLTRSWNAVGEPERNLSQEISISLFQRLMAPFGPKHQFSCVPSVLIETIGRPPDKWAFISKTIRAIYMNWDQTSSGDGGSGASRKKKRRVGAGEMEEEDSADVAEPSRPLRPEWGERPLQEAEEEEEEPPENNADPQGHSQCTSQEDCQGTEEDVLIRHILNGKAGDLYCATCWNSFLEQNPTLEGHEEER